MLLTYLLLKLARHASLSALLIRNTALLSQAYPMLRIEQEPCSAIASMFFVPQGQTSLAVSLIALSLYNSRSLLKLLRFGLLLSCCSTSCLRLFSSSSVLALIYAASNLLGYLERPSMNVVAV